MKITVNEQPQRFYLASEEWTPVVGHEIQVGDYRFCAIPFSEKINVSEVTTGAKVLEIPMNFIVTMQISTKEDAMNYFEGVGKIIKQKIGKMDFDKMLEDMQKIAFNKLGEMPPIENVEVGINAY